MYVNLCDFTASAQLSNLQGCSLPWRATLAELIISASPSPPPTHKSASMRRALRPPRPQLEHAPRDDIPASCSKSAECDFIDWRRWACRFSTQGRHAFSCLFLKQVVKWIVHIKGQHKTLATVRSVEFADFINQSNEFREAAFSILDRKRLTSKSRGSRPKCPQVAGQ